jgi:eukaryotic-like serine/threonine-protein kinase
MSEGGYGGPTGRHGGDWFAAEPYPQPPVISAPPVPPRQKTNTFATLSVVFAFLFAPAGAVLGHLGLAQIRRTGQRGRDRAVIGLTLSYAFILVAVVALVIWTVVARGPERSSTVAESPSPATPPATSSAAPDERLVTAAQLPKLLLSIDEVKQAVNAPNLTKVEDASGLSGDQGLNVNPRECVSSLFGGGASAYERTAVRGAFTRAISGDGNDGVILLNETMATFENIAAATQLVTQVVGQWRGCAGKSVTLIVEGNPLTLDVGQPIQQGAVMVLRNTLRGSLTGFSTDRAIAAKANVVLDLDAQGFDLGDSLQTITDQILERVPS